MYSFQKTAKKLLVPAMLGLLMGCALVPAQIEEGDGMRLSAAPYTAESWIADVIADPVFEKYGRLLFPVEDWYYSGDTLGQLQLTWYSNIDPTETVEIVNTLHDQAAAGKTVFYDIYTDQERRRTRPKPIRGYFSFEEKRGHASPSVMRAEVLPMWAQCRIAFPMRWSFPSEDTTSSHSSTALARRRPVRTWPGLSSLFLPMRRS